MKRLVVLMIVGVTACSGGGGNGGTGGGSSAGGGSGGSGGSGGGSGGSTGASATFSGDFAFAPFRPNLIQARPNLLLPDGGPADVRVSFFEMRGSYVQVGCEPLPLDPRDGGFVKFLTIDVRPNQVGYYDIFRPFRPDDGGLVANVIGAAIDAGEVVAGSLASAIVGNVTLTEAGAFYRGTLAAGCYNPYAGPADAGKINGSFSAPWCP